MEPLIFDEQNTINRILERIDNLRIEKGLSVSKLALEANLSENTLKHIFKKQTFPSLPTLYRVCIALDIEMWEFFSFEGKEVTSNYEEKELLRSFNRLNPKNKDIILYIANHLS